MECPPLKLSTKMKWYIEAMPKIDDITELNEKLDGIWASLTEDKKFMIVECFHQYIAEKYIEDAGFDMAYLDDIEKKLLIDALRPRSASHTTHAELRKAQMLDRMQHTIRMRRSGMDGCVVC